MITAFEEAVMRMTAAEKGFDSIADHLLHLTKESPQSCRTIYHHYTKIFNCEGKTSKECDKLRDYLMSDCGASCSGNSLEFSWWEKSHIAAKYIDKKYLLTVQAALRGVSEEKYTFLVRKRIWKPEKWGIYSPPS